MGEKANDMTDKELTLDIQFIQLNIKKKSN